MDTTSLKPLITTIIPTFRRPRLLRRAIKSVLNQTYKHFQVCVYDNASGDETASIVEELVKEDSRVKYHCHSKNIGAIKNFIYGMEHVESPFFTLLSDDDFLLPYFFELGMNALEETREAIFFAGATVRADFQGNIWDVPLNSWRDGVYNPPEGFIEMLKKGHPECTGIIFKREVLSRVGIDTMTGMASDVDFELRIAATHAIVVSKMPCAIFFSHPSSATSKGSLNNSWPGWLRMIENICSIEELPNEVRKQARRLLMIRLRNRVFMAGVRGALNGFKQDALQAGEILRDHFKDSLRTSLLQMLTSDSLIEAFLYYVLCVIRFIRRLYRKKTIPFRWQQKYRYLKDFLNNHLPNRE